MKRGKIQPGTSGSTGYLHTDQKVQRNHPGKDGMEKDGTGVRQHVEYKEAKIK
ncbi:MAG: 50S ribosomal protein L33 [Alteromonadaceae bacterium]|nr:50S ribosomal protein L33 [Alteromonadaceae bacterium]